MTPQTPQLPPEDEPIEITDWYYGITQKHFDQAIAKAVRAALEAQKAAAPEVVGLSEERVISAARILCRQHAVACSVNEHDCWTFYSDDFKSQAIEIITAFNGITPPTGSDK